MKYKINDFVRYEKKYYDWHISSYVEEECFGGIQRFYPQNDYIVTYDDKHVKVEYIQEKIGEVESEEELYEKYPEYFI